MAASRTSSRTRSGGPGASARGSNALPWHQAVPGPVVLVTGPESLLADRAVERVRTLARGGDDALGVVARPDLELVAVEGAGYRAGELAQWTSPSLFGEPRLVVVSGLETAPDVLVTDITAALSDLPDDVVLVLRHAGGPRATSTLHKALLAAARAVPGGVLVECPPVKGQAEQRAFAETELRSAGRSIEPAALEALLLAVGGDLRSLAAACAQLAADVPRETAGGGQRAARLTEDDVERYYGGRAEVTGFRVADAAVAGHRTEALRLLRQALDGGLDPVPLVAALAVKLRSMAKVGAAGRGSDQVLASGLGMSPWQVRTTRDALRGWTPEGIATSITALAAADEAVKGGGRDPRYAVERAVLVITAARAAD